MRPYGARLCGCCVYVCVCARVRVQPRMGVPVLALHFLLFLEGARVFVALLGRESQGPPRCPAWVQGTLDLPCALARSDRAPRKHEALVWWNMMSTHTDEVPFARRERGLENEMCAREGHVHVRRIDFNGSYKRLKPEDNIVVNAMTFNTFGTNMERWRLAVAPPLLFCRGSNLCPNL